MSISILPQDQDGQELFNAISSFFRTFRVGALLRKCNAQKAFLLSIFSKNQHPPTKGRYFSYAIFRRLYECIFKTV